MTDERAYGNRDIADLLPWYETGRLSAADRARVDVALTTDLALRQELVLVREEMGATIDVNEAQGVPSRQAVDRFFATLESHPRAKARLDPIRFIADRLAVMRPQTIAWGLMTALALVVLQAGVISHLASKGRDVTTYQSASVPNETAQSGPTLLVAFTPTANAGAIQKLLENNSLSIAGGPSAGYFSVRIDRRDTPSAQVDEIIARLNGRKDIIRSVMLQSPPD